MTEYKGWFWDSKTQDLYRWKDLPPHKESPNIKLWPHYCEVLKCWVGLETGVLCKDCGTSENIT